MIPRFPMSVSPVLATSVACAPVVNVAGGRPVIVTVTGVAVTIVATAVADLVGSDVDLAVIVIVPPTGTFEVLLNVAASPLAV